MDNVSNVAVEAVVDNAAAAVAAEAEKTKAERRANVDDKTIIAAYQSTAIMKDDAGNLIGNIEIAAEKAGMLPASFKQRITTLKGLGLQLAPMPRKPSTKAKKSVADLNALLASINSELHIETKSDETAGDESGEVDQTNETESLVDTAAE